MSDMKCPFCQQELDTGNYFVHCHNPHCNTTVEMEGTEEMWQELIRTRKELEQSEICCTEWEKQALDYKAENIALSGDLECTRKALEVVVDALKMIGSGDIIEHSVVGHEDDNKIFIANKALEQITALEQKDK